MISLEAGFTDDATLPVADTREIVEEVLGGRDARRALQYGSTQGEPHLRELTVDRLRRLDGRAGAPRCQATTDRTVITNGSQQLLYMLAEALFNPGDIVLLEDPTYFVFLGIVQSMGLRARTVRMKADGMDLAHLEAVLSSLKREGELARTKALYMVSYFQNPTGITTAIDRKRGALELLQRYSQKRRPIYLVEDAAYRELRFAGSDVPSTLSLDGAEDRVIVTGTYSKPFATGTRVGFGILPEPLLTTVLRIKGNHDFGTSSLLQRIVARALESGRYERHLERLRARYAAKAATMASAMRDSFPKRVQWDEPQGGLYFWARSPRRVSTGMNSTLFRTALGHEVLYVPGQICYADDPTRRKPNHEMRISFGNATSEQISLGVRRLGSVLEEIVGSGDRRVRESRNRRSHQPGGHESLRPPRM
jgi:2-aminoadipate transaminase